MGSPTVSNAKPVPMDNADKKSITKLLKSFFNKKKEKNKNIKQKHIEEIEKDNKDIKLKQDTVALIVENFKKIDITNEQNDADSKNEDDELDNFSFKVIEDSRNERIHSHSSEDSGFSDKSENSEKSDHTEKSVDTDKTENDDKCEDLAEDLEKLELSDEKKKNKKLQTVVTSRGPLRNKVSSYNYGNTQPYTTREVDTFRQIQINKQTLTGGQVIINQYQQPTDNLSEIDIACETLQQKSQYLQSDPETYLQDVLAVIHEDTAKSSCQIQNDNIDIRKPSPMAEKKMSDNFDTEKKAQEYYMAELENKIIGQDEILQLLKENNYEVPQTDPIEEMVSDTNFKNDMFQYLQTELNMTNDGYFNPAYTYPTPPRSETIPSPMSASHSSFSPLNTSEYTLSPQRSPIYNSDCEKYQYIPPFEEEKEAIDKKARERTASISSMTMKQYKDLQKEIVCNFSKRECCQLSRKSCLELFKERIQKIKIEDRKDLCMKVAKLDLKAAYGVLHHILLSLARGSEKENLEIILFSLICERVIAQDITMFTGEAGLNLLKAAALRCPQKPLLTRYLVECTRTAIKTNPSLAAGKDYVFHEVDALGDTLVIACARAGDGCSDALTELVRSHPDQPPLFKLQHNNADGYTALHVACSQHSASSPRLHTVHVLLEHGGFELTDGDLKGRDTALHLAVNSANCDLQLILLMFKHVDRKEWKNLAHCPNLSTKTPIDLARLATKSTSRPNYPSEVLEFLKKCR